MIPIVKQYKVWIVLMVISLLIVGCAPSPEEALDVIQEEQSPEVDSSSNSSDNTQIVDSSLLSPDPKAPATESTEEKIKETTTIKEDVVTAENATDNVTVDTKIYNVTDEYDPSNPTLMGFTIHDTLDQVLDRFDKPVSQSSMNDGVDPLQNYEYPGFVIGFDNSDRIVFIEVHSSDVNPGLNHLYVGQTIEEARKSLGAPVSLNEYVMIYASNHTIMKLDIDPVTSTIQSVKLFAE